MANEQKKVAKEPARVIALARNAQPESLSVQRFQDFAARLVAMEWRRETRDITHAEVSTLETLHQVAKLVPDEKE